MKIFALRPVSTLDRFVDFCKFIRKLEVVNMDEIKPDVFISENKLKEVETLKKGKDICHMLSE